MYYMKTGFCKFLFTYLVLFCFTGISVGSAFELPFDYDKQKTKEKWGLETVAFFVDGLSKKRVVALLIDKDTVLGIDFVTYLVSDKIGSWQGCNPFVISAVTNADDALDNAESRANLMASASEYADMLCPNAEQMRFYATSNINFSEGDAFFSAIVNKNKNGKWFPEVEISDKSAVGTVSPSATAPASLPEDKALAANAPFSVKVAFAHGKPDLDNLAIKSKVAELLGHPVEATAIVRIKQAGENDAWADWPFPIAIDHTKGKITKTGWFLVSGAVSPFPSKEKVRMGIKADAIAAMMYLTNATSCLDEKCHNLGRKYTRETEK